jgi:hypothetical protein
VKVATAFEFDTLILVAGMHVRYLLRIANLTLIVRHCSDSASLQSRFWLQYDLEAVCCETRGSKFGVETLSQLAQTHCHCKMGLFPAKLRGGEIWDGSKKRLFSNTTDIHNSLILHEELQDA